MKDTVRIICIFSFLNYSILASANQKTTSLNIAAASAINTQSAEVNTKGTWTLSLRNDYFQNQQLSNAQLLRFSAQTGREIESDGYLNYTYAAVTYGLTDVLTIAAIFPYTVQNNVRVGQIDLENKTNSYINNLGTAKGFGDATLYGQWLIWDNTAHQFSAMLTFGSSLPTGTTNARGQNDVLFYAVDQPGQGIWSPFIGAAITKTIKKESFSANILFTKSFVGTQNTSLGNVYDYNIAWVHELYESSSQLSLTSVLELNGEYTAHAISDHIKDPDTGGNIIYFTLGMRLDMPPGVSPYISFSPPILQTLNGIQSSVRNWFTLGIDITK